MPLPGSMESSNGSLAGSGRFMPKTDSMQRNIDEMRKHNAKLKAELEMEKARVKQAQRDRISEVKHVREQCTRDQEHALEMAKLKFNAEKESDLQKIRDQIIREKDLELRQILKYKDEEVKQIKSQFSQEKDDALKVAMELQRKQQGDSKLNHSDSRTIAKLQKEVQLLKEAKRELQRQYDTVCVADKEKAIQIRTLKHSHEQELQKVIRESKRQASKDYHARYSEKYKGDVDGTGDNLSDLRYPKTSTPLTGSSNSLLSDGGKDLNDLSKNLFEDKRVQQKVADLTSQVHRLENKVSGLKAENESLKKKQDDQKPAEEKIRKLKKRNAELGAIARRLEEKAKSLQQENIKKSKDGTSGAQDVDHVKKVFARQRAKDLAEHAKLVLAKDKELEQLRKQCQELAEKNANTRINQSQNSFEEQDELENIIKQAARERLQLEKQIAFQSKVGIQTQSAESPNHSKLAELKEENSTLRRELDIAEEATKYTEKLEIEVTQRRIECESLYRQIEDYKKKTADLEGDLQETIVKNTQLSLEREELRSRNSNLQDQLEDQSFSDGENDHLLALEETNKALKRELEKTELNHSKDIQHLEEKEKGIRKKYDKLEKENKQQVAIIREKEKLIEKEVETAERAERESERLRSELNTKISDIEDLKSALSSQQEKTSSKEQELNEQIQKNTQLTLQITNLQGEKKKLEKVNDECRALQFSLAEKTSECEAANATIQCLQDKVETLESALQHMQESVSKQKELETQYQLAVKDLQERQNEVKSLHKAKEDAIKENQATIDSLKAKVLELEHKCNLQSARHEEMLQEISALKKQAEAVVEIPKMTVEIQTEESPEVNEAANKRPPKKPPRKKSLTKSDQIRDHDEFDTSSWEHIHLHTDSNPDTTAEGSYLILPQEDPTGYSDSELSDIARKIKALSMSDSEDEIIQGKLTDASAKKDKTETKTTVAVEKMLKPTVVKASEADDSILSAHNSSHSSNHSSSNLLLKKSGLQVFVAKYDYDPIEYSPNDNPDAELNLNAGDYIYVLGDMDEDGFYEGELMDGRRGLVPSNFVEKVADADLDQIQTALGGISDHSSIASNSLQHDLDFNSSDESERLAEGSDDLHVRKPSDQTIGSDLEDIEEVDEENLTQTDKSDLTNLSGVSSDKNHNVPYPRNLNLDRQLNKSIVVSWLPPESSNPGDIQAYHVWVDGQFKTSVKGTERTKALVEGVPATEGHRVCVRSVTARGQSKDQECTLMIGKDASMTPSNIKVSHVTATTATVSWFPGSSKLSHVVYLNKKEQRTVKPGIFKHILTGLSPKTSYKVAIKALDNSSTSKYSSNTQLIASAVFTTTAGGVPDPPLDVQVESGPQEGTLLVSWLPVTIETSGTSNGAIVTGYSIFGDGVKVKDVDTPTADHVVLEATDLSSLKRPHHLTVRTKSEEASSTDSISVVIPPQLVREVVSVSAKSIAMEAAAKVAEKKKQSSSMYADASDSEDEEIQQLQLQPSNTVPKPTPLLTGDEGLKLEEGTTEKSPISPAFKPVETSSHSELSDITEEEECDATDSWGMEDLPGLGTGEHTPLHTAATLAKQGMDKKGSSSTKKSSNSPSIVTSTPEQASEGQKLVFSKEDTSPIAKQKDKSKLKRSDSPDNVRHKDSSAKSNKNGASKQTPRENNSNESSALENDVHELDDMVKHETHTESPRKKGSAHTETPRTKGTPRKGALSTDSHDSSKDKISHKDKKSNTSEISDHSDVFEETADDRRSSHGSGKMAVFSQQFSVPSIEITKDSDASSDVSYADDEFESYSASSPDNTGSPRSPQFTFDLPPAKKKQPENSRVYSGNEQKHKKLTKQDVINTQSLDQELASSLKEMKNSESRTENKKNKSKDKHDVDDTVDSVPNSSRSKKSHVDEVPNSNRSKKSLNLNDSKDTVSSNEMISPKSTPAAESVPESEGMEFGDEPQGESFDNFPEGPVRIFIALFDYDPVIMSPNPDAIDEELPFKEGQLIKIYGEQDDDGFYHGEANGCRGYVPCNMVSEVQVDDPDITEQLLNESDQGRISGLVKGAQETSFDSTTKQGANGSAAFPLEGPVRRMIALYDYDPNQLSPNVDADEVELPFNTGDILTVYGDMDEDGFFVAELYGRQGLVPSNFLQDLPDQDFQDNASIASSTHSRDTVDTVNTNEGSGRKKKHDKGKEKSPKKEKKKDKEKPGASPAAAAGEEPKEKKKKGFLAKGKNIFKKLTKS